MNTCAYVQIDIHLVMKLTGTLYIVQQADITLNI